MAHKHRKNAVGQLRRSSLRHGALDELAYSVADKAAHLVETARGEPLAFEGKIRRRVQILKRVQQRSVQIKNHKLFHSLSSAIILIQRH